MFRRLAAGWLALWFALASVDPGWLHACPMHGRGAVDAEMVSGVAPHDPSGHHGHASAHHVESPPAHIATAAPTEHSPAPQPGHDSHSCACLGDCASANIGIALQVAVGIPHAPIVPATHLGVATSSTATVPRVALVLPFATAPPARAS